LQFNARRTVVEKELITLSTREIERLRIIHKVMDRNMTQVEEVKAALRGLGLNDDVNTE